MRLVLRAGFDRYSGYGNDAVDLAIALDRIGIDVLPMPTGILPGLPMEFLQLMAKDPRGPKDVLVQFAPPFDIKWWQLREYTKDTPLVGYTMWERSPMVVEDFPGWVRTQGGEVEPMDITFQPLAGLIVTCPMNLDAIRDFAHTKMAVVPCGIDTNWPEARRSTKDRMRFLYAGMLAGRKDPFALIEAWKELKQERPDFDAQLYLHTLAPGLHPKLQETVPDLILSQRPLSPQQMVDLYHSAHVYVSVSRGEGNNKPAMEFMATGGAVMATDWSGHQNWLYNDATYALPGELKQAQGAPEGVEEFYVDRNELKRTLLHCWSHREEVSKKGEIAARWIKSSMSWDHVAERFAQTVASFL